MGTLLVGGLWAERNCGGDSGNRNTIYLFVLICHLLGRIISKFLTWLSCGLDVLSGFIFVVLVL